MRDKLMLLHRGWRNLSAIFLFFNLFTLFFSCKKNENPPIPGELQITSVKIGSSTLNLSGSTNSDVPFDEPIVATFNLSLDTVQMNSKIFLIRNNSDTIALTFSYLDNLRSVSFGSSLLEPVTSYTIIFSNKITGVGGETFAGLSVLFTTKAAPLKLVSAVAGSVNLLATGFISNVPRNFSALLKFNHPLNTATVNSNTVTVFTAGSTVPLTFVFSDSNKTVTISSATVLVHFQKYTINLSNQIKGSAQEEFAGFSVPFITELDTTPKFPVIPDDDLLTLVEQQTFKYFWDFGHPVSGLARERNNSGDVVTTGGSGFGVMAILVGIQRNFITRQEGVDRLETIINFLTNADRFHGAWPHWLNGSTGGVIPFSDNDDGADLVETAFMMQGLLTVRQFLNPGNLQENDLIIKINALWNSVEWDWFTQGGQDVLYWHWSPDKGWIMNLQIKGYDEALITYILAAGSPTHTIDASVYHNGWASNGAIINGSTYYDYQLPLGQPFGGPLFFAHYSFLGFDPHNLQDNYANYWDQNVNHTQINRAYCIDNPKNYVGYDEKMWGLTASDDPEGYDAHSPTNDNGTISPTAAVSSIPYTPQYSMEALKFFYYTVGDKLWGPYGFYDAFNPSEGWWATSNVAIDEGPIIVMIENYRTGLLWDLFMSCPEVTTAMNKLGFTN